MSNLDDNTRLVSLYKNDADEHPVIGYTHHYFMLSDAEQLRSVFFAKDQLNNEIQRLLRHRMREERKELLKLGAAAWKIIDKASGEYVIQQVLPDINFDLEEVIPLYAAPQEAK
jgi:hypothetical protein